ncbi:hypothetical protein EB001_19965 [bacterium]|jgi:hypothetical protein|nr:hypothetical protein [bacterium]
MKLIPLGSNQNLVQLNSGIQILFSYKTPVAAYVPGEGYYRTNYRWSNTTTKHINKWLRSNSAARGAIIVDSVDQSTLDNLAGL